MLVKTKSSLFRDLLYLQEVISHKQICSAAVKNGIKPSNLSKIIKSVEELTGKKLFIRNSHGLIPTEKAQQIAVLISELERHFSQIAEIIFYNNDHAELKLCIAPNIEIKNLVTYIKNHPDIKLTLCHCEKESDVSVGYCPPEIQKGRNIVENQVGKNISHKIWVACDNTENAQNLAHFIIRELHKESP